MIGAGYMTMLDGIKAVLAAGKTSEELEASISKKYGEEDFYLETNREYRAERNIYTEFDPDEREKLFGKAPFNVWQSFKAWGDEDFEKDKVTMLTGGDELNEAILRSYRSQMIYKWTVEYHDRYIENTLDLLRDCVKLHEDDGNAYDAVNWMRVNELKNLIGREEEGRESLLMQARKAVDAGDYEEISRLEVLIEEKVEDLRNVYLRYKRNIL